MIHQFIIFIQNIPLIEIQCVIMRRQYPPKERLWTTTMNALQWFSFNSILRCIVFFHLNFLAKQKFSINCGHVYYAENSVTRFCYGGSGYADSFTLRISFVFTS